MIQDLRRWLTYDEWANREVLRGFSQPGAPPLRSLKLLAHIAGTQAVWCERLLGQEQTTPVWPDWTLEQLAAELPRVHERSMALIESLAPADLAGEIVYRNSKGETHRSRREDVLMHVVLHSVYHRGQIAADMRAAGFQPAYTDFIHATRRQLV